MILLVLSAHLLGVAADGKHAYVMDGLTVETVEVATGKVTDTWTASKDLAGDQVDTQPFVEFASLEGDRAADLATLAALATDTGQATRAYWLNGQETASGFMYVVSGEVHLVDRKGKDTTPIAAACAKPKVSPDGKRVACDDGLEDRIWVATVGKKSKAKSRKSNQLIGFQWSVDGKSVLAIDAHTDCLMRFAATTLKPKKVACDVAGFAQSTDGKTIAVLDADRLWATWIDARTGKKRASKMLPAAASEASEDYALSSDGLFAALDGRGGLVVADLAHDRAATVTAKHGYFEGVRATRWIGTSIVVLDGSEVRAVDVAATLP